MSECVLQKYEGQAKESELGKKSHYDTLYNAKKLYSIPRADKRQEIGIDPTQLPFFGFDCWNHYEVSWLNEKGKPIVAMAEIVYDCSSPLLIESKSLKLYFNSFNNTTFKNVADVEKLIEKDLADRIKADVFVVIHSIKKDQNLPMQHHFDGDCLDDLDVQCSIYQVHSSFLSTSEEIVAETLYSDLLKSNCLVTTQPDWGSVQIEYEGRKINREGLLKYLVSFRNYNAFHEQCIERIFVDIMKHCQPKQLTVYGRYTRRGGLDINPYRSTHKSSWVEKNVRLIRQ